MTTKKRLLTLSSLAVAVLLVGAPLADASNSIAKNEGEVCTTCHDKPGSRLLTSEGKYFEVYRSLDGYEQFVANLGACTSCHVRKPGSLKLTREGKALKKLGKDMTALNRWILEEHPTQTEAAGTEQPSRD